MTEQDWLHSKDAAAMLRWLEGLLRTDNRKLRLFVNGACQLTRQQLHPGVCRLLDVVEEEAARPSGANARRPIQSSRFHDAMLALRHETLSPLDHEVRSLACWVVHGVGTAHSCASSVQVLVPYLHSGALADLARDLFGNPFYNIRQVRADLYARLPMRQRRDLQSEILFVRDWRAWQGGLLVQLARGIEEDRAYDRLPILADALEDAGCAEPLLLDHCRAGGLHTRGCWLLDLLLGRR